MLLDSNVAKLPYRIWCPRIVEMKTIVSYASKDASKTPVVMGHGKKAVLINIIYKEPVSEIVW